MSTTMRQMLEAGVHFGHQTRYWTRRWRLSSFGHRKQDPHHQSREDDGDVSGGDEIRAPSSPPNKGTLPVVGTKRQAREIIREEAERCGRPLRSIIAGSAGCSRISRPSRQSIKGSRKWSDDRRRQLEKLPKKKACTSNARWPKLQRKPRASRRWQSARCPVRDSTSVTRKGRSPRAKSSASPDRVSTPTFSGRDRLRDPGNDDSSRAIRLYARGIADAILEGRSQVVQEIIGAASDEFVEVEESRAKAQ